MTTNALVVVDVQNGFINDSNRHVIGRIKGLLDQRLFDHALFTRFHNRDGSPYERQIRWQGLKTPEERAIVDELHPYAKQVFDKDYYTCFTPDFKEYLQRHGIKDLYFVGVDTNICVTKCAADAFEQGYVPRVLGHYCASHSGEHLHDYALDNLTRFIGWHYVIKDPISEVPEERD